MTIEFKNQVHQALRSSQGIRTRKAKIKTCDYNKRLIRRDSNNVRRLNKSILKREMALSLFHLFLLSQKCFAEVTPYVWSSSVLDSNIC